MRTNGEKMAEKTVTIEKLAEMSGLTTGRLRQLVIAGRLPGEKKRRKRGGKAVWHFAADVARDFATRPRKGGRPRKKL